jgi:sulfur carrier protein ThiS
MYRPINIQSISQPPIKSFGITSFRGVDLRRSKSQVANTRSPDAVNMRYGSNPESLESRNGIKYLWGTPMTDDDPEEATGRPTIYGIHIYTPLNELLFHAGSKMYLMSYANEAAFLAGNCTYTVKYTGLTRTSSVSFMFEGKLYIVGCGKYLVYDGVTVEEVANNSHTFIPTTVIGRAPSGGGTAFEAVNLLSKWRKNRFYATHSPTLHTDTFNGNASTTVFTLTTTSNFTNDPWVVKVNGSVVTVTEDRVAGTITFATAPPSGTGNIVVEYYTEDLDNLVWDRTYKLDTTGLDADTVLVTVNGVAKTEGSATPSETPDAHFYVDRTNGYVVFYPGEEPKALAGMDGVDNVIITFAKTVAGYADQINKCSVFGIFGGANDSRVFLSGNSDTPNKDWHSGLYDATYFPDTGYTYIGSSNVAIMGYVKQYNTQMIIKESSQMDSSAYLRTFSLDSDNFAVFPIEQGATAIGAVSKRSFAYLDGYPLFVSKRGVEIIRGTNVDNQRTISNVSELINSRLSAMSNLSGCVCITMGTNYHVFINGEAFVCDSRMKYRDDMGQAQYEWMPWKWSTPHYPTVSSANIYTVNGKEYLILGSWGMIYRFKTDSEIAGAIHDEISPTTTASMPCYWKTANLIFNDLTNKKRVREICVMLEYGEVKVSAIIDGYRTVQLGSYATGSYSGIKRILTMFEKIDKLQLQFDNGAVGNGVGMGIASVQITYQNLND